jgi:phage major head subunit gpT-like protein
MSKIINFGDVFSATAEQQWATQKISQPEAWRLICKMLRMMAQTEGKVPRVNEDVVVVPWESGGRIVQGTKVSDFRWDSKKFEVTAALDQDEQSDLASIGVFFDTIGAMGKARLRFFNEMAFGFLISALTADTHTYSKLGKEHTYSTLGFDGARLFDNTHTFNSTNCGDNLVTAGAGPYWFLVDSAQVEPVFFGEFREFDFYEYENQARETGDRKWGMDGRYAIASGNWRAIGASNRALTGEYIEELKLQMSAFYNDDGTPGGTTPDLLIVPGALEIDALQLMKPINDAGATNIFNGMMRTEVVRWLPNT